MANTTLTFNISGSPDIFNANYKTYTGVITVGSQIKDGVWNVFKMEGLLDPGFGAYGTKRPASSLPIYFKPKDGGAVDIVFNGYVSSVKIGGMAPDVLTSAKDSTLASVASFNNLPGFNSGSGYNIEFTWAELTDYAEPVASVTGSYKASSRLISTVKPTLIGANDQKGNSVNLESFGIYNSTAVDNGDGSWLYTFESVKDVSEIPNPSIWISVATIDGTVEPPVNATQNIELVFTKTVVPVDPPISDFIGSYTIETTVKGKSLPEFGAYVMDGKGSTVVQNFSAEKTKVEGEFLVKASFNTKLQYKTAELHMMLDGEKVILPMTFAANDNGGVVDEKYTFKDSAELKAFMKAVNDDARNLLTKVNQLESIKLKQERILDSADRLYESYVKRLNALQARLDSLTAVRDQRVESLLQSFDVEATKASELEAEIAELNKSKDYASRAAAAEKALTAAISDGVPPVIKTNFEKIRLSEAEAVVVVRKNVETEKSDILAKLTGKPTGDLADGIKDPIAKAPIDGGLTPEASLPLAPLDGSKTQRTI